MRNFLISRFSPFRHPDFCRFYAVRSLSQIGKWSHELARAWIIVEMFGQAGALGSILLAIAIPSTLLILYGGVIVDKVDVKRIYFATNALMAIASLTLFSLTEFSQIQFWHLLIFGLIEGLSMAFSSPAYQTLNVRLVPKEDFQQALALNSINFHIGRTLGPIIAGLLMAWHGPSLVFLFDGISYLVVMSILLSLNLKRAQVKTSDSSASSAKALINGLGYIWRTPNMRYKVLQLVGSIALLYPLVVVVFRAYLSEKFSLSSDQFGFVFMWPALGAAVASMGLTMIKPTKPLRALLLGVPINALCLCLLAFTNSLLINCIMLAGCGFANSLSWVSLTMSLHLDVEEEFRGRMASLIGLGFLSIGPLMSFPVGYVSDQVGYEIAIYASTAVFLLMSAILAALHWHNWESKVEVGAQLNYSK